MRGSYRKLSVMSRSQRVVYGIIMLIGIGLTVIFGVWWFQSGHIPHNFQGNAHVFDVLLFALLSYVVWYQIIYEIFSWYIAGFMKRPEPAASPALNLKVALLTAFVPGKEPYDMLEHSLEAMIAVDYPHDTWVLDEGDDAIVKDICQKLGVRHYSRKNSIIYNAPEGAFKRKTKAGNYNSWFDRHSKGYDIVAQHDVDFVPRKNFLMKTLGYFQDPDIASVGTPQIYGNKDASWIARGAAEQQYGFYGPTQKGLYGGYDMPLFIGANHVIRRSAHDDIGGYAGHIVEDHLTGMKLYARRWKSIYLPDILLVGEGPATWDAYFSQQMRWAYGLIDILFFHSPRIFRAMKLHHIINYFLLQQYYFYGIVQAIGIFLITLYCVFGLQTTSMPLVPLLAHFVPLLAFQLVVFLWLQRFNIDSKHERGLLLRGRLLALAAWPVYFLAYLGVIVRRRLAYTVTPKGSEQDFQVRPGLFAPHIILGTITALDVVIALFTGRYAPLILFWALLNTGIMYGFFFNALIRGRRSATTVKKSLVQAVYTQR